MEEDLNGHSQYRKGKSGLRKMLNAEQIAQHLFKHHNNIFFYEKQLDIPDNDYTECSINKYYAICSGGFVNEYNHTILSISQAFIYIYRI